MGVVTICTQLHIQCHGSPHVVDVVAVYEREGSLLLVMECMSGGDLFEYISAQGDTGFTERGTSLVCGDGAELCVC